MTMGTKGSTTATTAMPAQGHLAPRTFGRVGVLYGGRSSERDVSIRSGAAVLRALREAGVDAHEFDPAMHTLAELEAARFDRVFCILHGRYGEDGAIQGVLETLRVPYTGSGIRASAVAMDKPTTKEIWTAAGLPTPAWLQLARDDDVGAAFARCGAAEFAPGLVVKPAREGSSFGAGKVGAGDRPAFEAALREAWKYDAQALIEERIIGRELTCALLGEGADTTALPLVEICAPDANYDYQNKYFGDRTEYRCPAPLDPALAQRIQDLCVRAYRAIGARGWGRIDVMLRDEADGAKPYLLELNTAPGMTDHSLVPMAARAAGIDFPDLVLRILAGARLELGA
ncbi:D-alanine-D-alanine ligase [Burkholderiales bacterium GJ-E10]|nr:D-alanine-D-alanine ligase [Burkholderiales bacterium GJ-E10]